MALIPSSVKRATDASGNDIAAFTVGGKYVQGVVLVDADGAPVLTLPISVASLPLPSGAATQTTLASVLSSLNDVLSDLQSKADLSETQPVSLATAPTTPVTGTFWQATQPVSIASMPSTPVTGTFWQATQPVSAASLPLPSGAATEATLAAGVKARAGYVDESGNALTVKRAFANVAASQTDSSVVAAVTSKKIRVLALFMLTGSTATTVTFNTKGAGAGTAISGAFANAANGGAVLPETRLGWLETSAGEALTVTTGAGSTTAVHVVYVEV